MTESRWESELFAVELMRAPPLYAHRTLRIMERDHPWDGRSLEMELSVVADAAMATCRIGFERVEHVHQLREALDRYLSADTFAQPLTSVIRSESSS